MPYKNRQQQLEYFKVYNSNRPEGYWLKINNNRRNYLSTTRSYHIESLFIYALDIVCDSYHHSCKHCGFTNTKALQFDHINGGGEQDRKNGMTGSVLYLWVLNNPEEARQKFQILCSNCNWIKRWELRETNA